MSSQHPFVDREAELQALERWWSAPAAGLSLLWGRRRVGKTLILQRFASQRRSVFHTGAGRPQAEELRVFSHAAAPVLAERLRDLDQRPFSSWPDALETLAEAARDESLLLVLDEFPELSASSPDLAGVLRAFLDRVRGQTQLRVALCGSAVRTMRAVQEERAPLYGRIDLSMLVHPFEPHEAAMMLPALDPPDRALVWGIVGGMPLYLSWWDQQDSIRGNLHRLVGEPGGQLLNEGHLVLATEAGEGQLDAQVLRAIAAGRTKHNEIETAIRADPSRSLARLVGLRLVERQVPVTEDPRRTRRRTYRIADPFLAFWLSLVEPHRSEIERGLGRSIIPVLVSGLDDHMGARWEEAFRAEVRRRAAEGAYSEDVVAVGPFWRDAPPIEIDAVVLAGRARTPVAVGEAKWARSVDGARVRRSLERKAAALPGAPVRLEYIVGAREAVRNADGLHTITAAEIFGD